MFQCYIILQKEPQTSGMAASQNHFCHIFCFILFSFFRKKTHSGGQQNEWAQQQQQAHEHLNNKFVQQRTDKLRFATIFLVARILAIVKKVEELNC
jgi:hypothetical protein